ncbi:MAG: hypothetical protein A3G33_09750 [Omnitrophica bacterium RIFCSPLOWO2_12_FULL_44_17]|uniref:Probable membrane transporter protein n=1 Tax=Candidatus Danuiimicrobium aquiferis TaxID=1801832 RepID=A0A1G1KX17_9BACT|nr:MAG: hypothetical protein A3B72_09610 [Omnitrophica bacterium RIFCSPHIGHO2_02_FULL_45_28]OGW97463.1 MAG: hypothetical protein A3G33_09750 [Omnitrophica bacterium RIFCSPLOWO2_12_FULL_44_17]OGX04535.1 MAG: hypothetical protein A3J12_10790 [Omnitrophica bacterium RIFCSPLOWO2_02_FULL_44_11]
MTLFLTVLICLIAGLASSLLGIGGGAILVPLFHYLLKMDMHLAIGTSLAVIIPTTLAGTFQHIVAKNVDWRVFAIASVCAIIGAIIGANLCMKIDAQMLKKIFAVFILLIAIRMLIQ